MNLHELLDELFPDGHEVGCDDEVLVGSGRVKGREVAVIGTAGHAAIGIEIALNLADAVLQVIESHPGRPILMLVDTQGQRLGRRDELLGINGYLAHLAKCLEMARQRGHRLISLVYAEAVSGGFLSFGMMADEIHTLQEAQVRVMNLPAMARITKIPLERLEELSIDSPAFAPGIDNFFKLGGVESVWSTPLSEHLEAALTRKAGADTRSRLGLDRKGRVLAYPVARRVCTERV